MGKRGRSHLGMWKRRMRFCICWTVKKLLGNDVEVQLERGSLFITIDKGEAIMTGLAEISFRGNIEV